MKIRNGIALIELIFAMVIIAITLLAVPNLMQTTKKSAKSVISQESISNAASYMNMIMSTFWDENCTDPKYENPILYVQKQDPNLQEQSSGGALLGHRVGSAFTTSRRFRNNLSAKHLDASKLLRQEVNDGEADDIDDFNGKTTKLIQREVASVQTGEYKDTTITLNTKVNYIDGSADNGFDKQTVTFNNPFSNTKIENRTTNIKSITLTLKSQNEPDKKIVLRAFSCNIGSAKLKERIFTK